MVQLEPKVLWTVGALFLLQIVLIGNSHRKRTIASTSMKTIGGGDKQRVNATTKKSAAAAALEALVPTTVPTIVAPAPTLDPTPFDVHTPGPTASSQPTYSPSDQRDNVLFIVLDQLRYDSLGHVQARMDRYDGKLHIRTPNVDELARRGVSFATAYCQSPSCSPSRATLKTGCTVARHGICTNKILRRGVLNRAEATRQRIRQIRTFEQAFARKLGYRVETYGKWHFPTEFWDPVASNCFDYHNESFGKDPNLQTYRESYWSALDAFRDEIGDVQYRPGDQENLMSGRPYTPFRLDGQYGMPTKSPRGGPGMKRWMSGEGGVCGVDALSANFTSTAMLSDTALRALDRLIGTGDPFLLSVHFNAPHPPYVAAGAYVDNYWSNRSNLFVAPSIRDSMKRSAYANSNQRRFKDRAGPEYGYDDPEKLAELTAVIYAMVEEVDHHVGRLMEKIDATGLSNKTLIVFTSDHGELLGAHSMTGKGVLLEEATRVPLILVQPGKLPAGAVVHDPVSQLDLAATLLDYGGGIEEKTFCDGSSLRRFVERQSYNADYDERTVFVELDNRYPRNSTQLTGKLGARPNFMVRKGNHKLMITRRAKSKSVDMLYDLTTDPYELKNLLPASKSAGSPVVIGKAEHLRVLLLEFLQSHDGVGQFYSSNRYHLGEGEGDIEEIRKRRKWKAVSFWQSDRRLSFGPPALVNGKYTRVEYLYFGSTTNRILKVQKVLIQGADAQYFRASTTVMDGYVRIRVVFTSDTPVALSELKATVVVKNSATGTARVPIVGEV